MKDSIEKAEVLIEAIPYIQKFSGCTVVVKYGGSAMVNPELKKSVVKDLAMLKYLGLNIVVVHGGGKDISSFLERIGKKSKFVDGQRVTDEETAAVAEMVLSGSISKMIVQELEDAGIMAVGINGKDGHLLQCSRKPGPKGEDIGFVGEVEHVNTSLVRNLMSEGYVPVVSPVGFGNDGKTYNINADYCASALAGALGAQKLVFLTDVEGILRDKDDPSTRIARLTRSQAVDYLANGVIKGGMIPKVECCLSALEHGVTSVHVLDGRLPHSMLLEIFTTKGIGTMVVKDDEENQL
ncbi:MAG: acetylglutamate kinase [Spirochaetia bacterium]|nr:acetylglutamate kinase [Spirochaetia bacterium]